jgi:HAD domain in Swiss Army Knife RNA repair proteins
VDAAQPKPLLMVDIDGVVSLFGVPAGATAQAAEGTLHAIEGIPHFLSSTAAAHLLALAELFELVWASGWEEKANEHLPHLLGLPAALPFLRFSRDLGAGRRTHAHWKLEAIEAYARRRPLAWIDDAFNAACHEWAQTRPAPTLLVQTEPTQGLTSHETGLLVSWAGELEAGRARESEAARATELRAG